MTMEEPFGLLPTSSIVLQVQYAHIYESSFGTLHTVVVKPSLQNNAISLKLAILGEFECIA